MTDFSSFIDGIPLRQIFGAVFIITLLIWVLFTAAFIYHWRGAIFKKEVMVTAEIVFIAGSLLFIGAATFILLTIPS